MIDDTRPLEPLVIGTSSGGEALDNNGWGPCRDQIDPAGSLAA